MADAASPRGLPPAVKIVQLLFPGFRFGSDDPAEAERLVDLGVGGFCLYGGSVSEVFELTRRLQGRARIPLLFCADYEDGLFRHVAGGTALPSNMAVGASGREDLAFEKARITATESLAIGVPWILAPVADLATCAANPIVNTRSFGASPDLAARMVRAYVRGLSRAGALSCLKHFPGHGETSQDSHLTLPRLSRTRAQLSGLELVPFKRASAAADAVMLAHLYIPALTGASSLPASLSARTVSLLRRGLGYRGLVVTDALSMNAIAARFKEEKACAAALSAGADVLLVPAAPLQAAYALPRILEGEPKSEKHVSAAYARLMRLKKSAGLFETKGLATEEGLAVVGSDAHKARAEAMAAACLAWVRPGKGKDRLPLSGGARRGNAPGAAREELHLARGARYLEIETENPEEWQGKAFVEELRARGISVRPYRPGETGPVIAASFIRPRAYSGRIQLSAEERRRAARALSKQAGSVLVSFGNPFVFDQARGWTRGLCAFSEIDASQKAAAQALAGSIPAPGRMPVSLGCCGVSR